MEGRMNGWMDHFVCFFLCWIYTFKNENFQKKQFVVK
jgi:hypothetical protein